MELPQDKTSLVYTLDQRGQVQRLLVPDGESGTFLPIAVAWDNQGRLVTLSILQDSTSEIWRIGSFSDAVAPIPLPARMELRGEKDQKTVVFNYSGTGVTETWYDESAVAVALYQYRVDDQYRLRYQIQRDEQGQVVSETSYDYNSQNMISRIIGPSGTMTALYDPWLRPLELRRWMKKKTQAKIAASKGAEGNATSQVQAASQAQPASQAQTVSQAAQGDDENPKEELYRFQWGDDGLLRRITGYAADGTPLDYRYDYKLDSRGSWVERKTTSMEERFGLLVPQWGLTVERKITYFKEGTR